MSSADSVAAALATLPADTQIYLQPIGPAPGAPMAVHGGLCLGGSALAFTAVRVIARQPAACRSLDALLSAAELPTLLSKISAHYAAQVQAQLDGLHAPRGPLVLGKKTPLAFTRPLVMGVVNVTPDSFSDGGDAFSPGDALARARVLLFQGADIVDIGGESTRPGAKPVWEGEERDRVIPVIEGLSHTSAVISIDTRHASVMDAALQAGAQIINDVSALSHDPDAMAVAAASAAPVVLMHAQGTPGSMQDAPEYTDVILDVFDYLQARIKACMAAGIARERLIIDPGIGFGKRVIGDNMALLGGLAIFHMLGVPLLVGASRKRFIGAITGVEDPKERMPGSLAVAVQSALAGTHIMRVHDAGETRQALTMAQAYLDTGAMDAATITG